MKAMQEDDDYMLSLTESFLNETKRKLNFNLQCILQSIFGLVIVLGTLGNLIVIWTVLWNKHMRTSINLFTLNLAISDLILCVFSIPFMMYKGLNHMWNFGDVMCRLSNFSQATNVICSSITIASIALDRYISIFNVNKQQTNQNKNSLGYHIVISMLIWIFSFLLSSPLLIFSEVKTHPQNISFPFAFDMNHCVENWLQRSHQLMYSIAILVIQFLVPNLIVFVANIRISVKLRRHYKQMQMYVRVNTSDNTSNLRTSTRDRASADQKRHRKLNILLKFIAIIYALSWLPLSIFNLLSDSNMLDANQTYYLLNIICILFAMSSAISNPILYGFFNENFKREYMKLFARIKSIYARFAKCPKTTSTNTCVDTNV